MPITTNSKLIAKYVPEKHIVGSNIEVDNSGYTLLRDNYFSIFPSIMEYMDKDPFGIEETTLRYRWSAYVIIEGSEYLVISRNEDIDSLYSELSANGIEIFSKTPKWYVERITEQQNKVMQNIWKAYIQKNVIIYTMAQSEYGYMQNELHSEKYWLYGKEVNVGFVQKLKAILIDKKLKGLLDNETYKQILNKYDTKPTVKK